MEGGASVAATGVKIVAKNQKAYHEYFIEEKFETGIELSGTEVKSIRLGNLSLKEAWCQIKDGLFSSIAFLEMRTVFSSAMQRFKIL